MRTLKQASVCGQNHSGQKPDFTQRLYCQSTGKNWNVAEVKESLLCQRNELAPDLITQLERFRSSHLSMQSCDEEQPEAVSVLQ